MRSVGRFFEVPITGATSVSLAPVRSEGARVRLAKIANDSLGVMEGYVMETVRIETNLRHIGDIPVLDVDGEIDIYTTPQFKEAVAGVIEEGRRGIIINMSRVSYMDSSGFGTLLSATKRLRALNGSLHLVGCNDAISRMLQITRLNTIFGVHPTERDALDAIYGDVTSPQHAAVAA